MRARRFDIIGVPAACQRQLDRNHLAQKIPNTYPDCEVLRSIEPPNFAAAMLQQRVMIDGPLGLER